MWVWEDEVFWGWRGDGHTCTWASLMPPSGALHCGKDGQFCVASLSPQQEQFHGRPPARHPARGLSP